MSSEVEEKSSSKPVEPPIQVLTAAKTLPKFLYSRDQLLSLSGLDICKTLPRGFDASFLSDCKDAFNLEQQRGTYFQKRTEYISAQSNKFDGSNNYSRGGHGRWDTRSSGSSDREELQPDRDSDSGRRYLNPSRRSWQRPEHAGLLGKPSGYSEQVSAQRHQENSSYQLSKTTEPYQPPRSCKATPYSRSNTDSFNDETFGTSECSSQDRVIEERKRRESFELMRKEQHKSLQEKQNISSDKHNEGLNNDYGNKNSKGNLIPLVSQQNDSRSSLQQTLASRPLVPPGFRSTGVEKKTSSSLSVSLALEVEKSGAEDNHLITASGTDGIYQKGATGKECAAPLCSEVPALSSNYMIHNPSGLWESTENRRNILINDSTNKKVMNVGCAEADGHDQPTSILDKLFESALTRKSGGLSDFIEADEEPSGPLSLSSKFVQYFNQDGREVKPPEGSLSVDVLSLVSNDKVGSQVSADIDKSNVQNVVSDFATVNIDNSQNLKSSGSSVDVGKQESHVFTRKTPESSNVMTCEYIEQLMMAEANVESSSLHDHVSETQSEFDVKPEPQKNHVNNQASQHLLSLLQQGPILKDAVQLGNQNIASSSEELCTFSAIESGIYADNVETATGTNPRVESSLTLEALFGTAFMKELQSSEAPVSAQKGVLGKNIISSIQDTHDLQFLHNNDDDLFSSISRVYGSHVNDTTSTLGIMSSKNQEIYAVSESLQAPEIKLPEEEILVTGTDVMHPTNLELFPVEIEVKKELLLSNIKNNIVDKLAPQNFNLVNDRDPLPPGIGTSHSVYGMSNRSNTTPPYQELYAKPSSLQFPYHQANQRSSLGRHLDSQSRINSQINFMGPDSVHHSPHHYPTNMIDQHSLSNSGGLRFHPASNFQIFPNMQMSENFPPPHVHDYPRGVLPAHSFNNVAKFHEMNQVDALPLHTQRPDYGNLGVGMPGPVIGSGVHPDTIESLIKMEMRANSRQKNFVPGAPSSGNFSPEIDMAFRFR